MVPVTHTQARLTILITASLLLTGAASALTVEPAAIPLESDPETRLPGIADAVHRDHLPRMGQMIMEDPELAKPFAQGVASGLLESGLSLEKALVAAVDALGIEVAAPTLAGPTPTLADAVAHAWDQHGKPLGDEEYRQLQVRTERLDPLVERALAGIVHAANQASEIRGEPMDGLTDMDLYRLALRQDTAKDLVPGDQGSVALIDPDDLEPTDLQEIEDILSRIDIGAVLRAHWVLASATDDAISLLEDSVPTVALSTSSGDIIDESTPYGRLRVSGTDDHQHTVESFLHIDLGGDDTYLNRAGAVNADLLGLADTPLPPDPDDPAFLVWVDETRQRIQDSHDFSIEIDVQGDDTYAYSGSGAQGYGGFGGFGALVDLGGQDSFTGNTFAQGAGQIVGAGFLVNAEGNDRFSINHQGQGFGQDGGGGFLLSGTGSNDYTARTRAQGVGWAANLAGMLVDAEGDDDYRCTGVLDFSDSILPIDLSRPGSICQAVGWGGTGILVDGVGNDLYDTRSSFQSMALIGLAIQVDLAGNDRYLGGEWSKAMGVLGPSILLDGGGDDTYTSDQVEGPWVDTYVGSNGMGYTAGVGVLVDIAGNDRYTSFADKGLFATQYGCGQGCVNDLGVGALIDGGGNDRFRTEVGQGGSVTGYSILASGGGDDTFIMDHNSRRAQGFAQVLNPTVALTDCSVGVLWNLGGQNSYSNPTTDFGTRGTDTHWGQGDFGRGMDGASGTAGYATGELWSDALSLLFSLGCTT